ncbi:hypothetical protein halTADL_2228 [Halohasta litchfieldiae]|jgi:hypothetical protein|uniref:Phage tail assembly chaperone protein, E, or 41 or 14 n=1 Tax=Halohasta litchfieldiae TaxID=1073996 RepID=A0A1H6VLR7_9EURY|nr:hypothetical protein [Halohasta litchfieldiae]ATW88975.1 hypothetical protein halTADL_2228 [Halohasta litchfieldiae]SEJ01670.1 hypothetical protein SAMN05444271_11647 [Halohasta litchfieldiae]
MTDSALQTEHEFTLPQGYVDDDGTLHKEGRMRLATAADEIKPLKDPRVQSNSSYLTVVLLSRVVTELGDLETVDPDVIESLFVTDLEFLQSLYEQINTPDDAQSAVPGEASGLEPTGMDAVDDGEAMPGNTTS